MKRCVISWHVCFSLILTQQQQQQHQDEKTSSVCERVHTTSPTKHRHSSTQRGTQTGERVQAEMETKKAQQPLDQSESPTHTRRAAAMVWLGVRWLGWFIRSFLLFAFWSTAASDEKTRRARRARIEARTATLRDHKAEIAAQERELAAAVQKQSEIDSKLEAAGAKQSEYEKKRDKRKEQLAALRDAEVKAALRRRLARQKELGDRICKLEADIHELKQRMGTWRA